jgi:DNA-binding transcriptional ArsR family regulator
MDPLSAKLGALADPTRRAILARLALGETTLSELARPFDMTVPAVAKHLNVLERAGLVTRRQQARRKPFSLEREAMADVAHWVERYRRHWEESFDRLALLLDDRETTDG